MSLELLILVISFFFIACIYASVGFGGGSSYIAILALFALPFAEIRLTALICNIIVVSGGVFIYLKHHYINWRKILPITLASVPMAFLGAKLKISEETYYFFLGITLIAAAVLLWSKTSADAQPPHSNFGDSPAANAALGGFIGFISGLVGIGGGIFLAPILNLLSWDTAKKIAATASFFILVNSISGIFGQLSNFPLNIDYLRILFLCIAVFLGGQLGSRLSVNWNVLWIKRITAILVLVAGINVLFRM